MEITASFSYIYFTDTLTKNAVEKVKHCLKKKKKKKKNEKQEK